MAARLVYGCMLVGLVCCVLPDSSLVQGQDIPSCPFDLPHTSQLDPYSERLWNRTVERMCYRGTCHTEDLPRTYLAYHLNGQTINMDGKLDDAAWQEVPWTQNFVDIRGAQHTEPFFDTKVKVRWDDERLYIGAWMQQFDFWGNITQDETHVWEQNAFEVYTVPDGSMHNYKEMEINVLNTTWDLSIREPYIDNHCWEDGDVVNSTWASDMQKNVYTDGVINDPTAQKGTFWSVEWSLSFEALAELTKRTTATPADQEAWFFIFARPEYPFKIVDGQYQKDEKKETNWWSWQPMYTVNLHLPNRFGLVQFKRDMNDTVFHYEKWHVYRALFEIFEAEHKYKALNDMFVSDVHELDIAPKYLSSKCVSIAITLTDDGFEAVVTSLIDAGVPVGHIRRDRYVWFT